MRIRLRLAEALSSRRPCRPRSASSRTSCARDRASRRAAVSIRWRRIRTCLSEGEPNEITYRAEPLGGGYKCLDLEKADKQEATVRSALDPKPPDIPGGFKRWAAIAIVADPSFTVIELVAAVRRQVCFVIRGG
jgi:hypothetical protein